jgi:O-antigen/teichoic acid export membrane protein
MSRQNFFSVVSASTVQALLSQSAGVLVFIMVSRWLDKPALGQLSWMLALLMIIFSVLGAGLEHIAVQKIATGANPAQLLPPYLMHVVTAILLFLAVCIVALCITGVDTAGMQLFVLLAAAQCLLFLANPFRPVANGLQRFRMFFIMSSVANLLRPVLVALLAVSGAISVINIGIVYLFSAFAELLVCILIYRFRLKQFFRFSFSITAYLRLLKEGWPQFGTTVLNTAIGRMDWLLMGWLAGTIAVAEYSFVYRVFELAVLPLLVIAPMLFPQVAKLFSKGSNDADTLAGVHALVRMEMALAVFTAVMLCICWEPVMDMLTVQKYGREVKPVILVLCFGLPLVYVNNVFWSILFARKKLTRIFRVFVAGFVVNFCANFLLMPSYGPRGAALAMVLTLLLQSILYILQCGDAAKSIYCLLPIGITGIAVYQLCNRLPVSNGWQPVVATIIYWSLLIVLRQVRRSDWPIARKLIYA